jgi:predicted transcriptional regulator
MTGDDFTAWMKHMGLSIGEAADRLGLGRNTVPRYMRDGAPAHIGYACAAIAMGLPQWAAR